MSFLNYFSNLTSKHLRTVKQFFAISFLFGLFGFLPQTSYSQISHGGQPKSFNTTKRLAGDTKLELSFDEIILKSPDISSLRAEDLQRENDLPPRVGTHLPISISKDSGGEWTNLPEGGRLWLLKITVPNAKALSVSFDDWHLAKGCTMFFYNENRKHVIGEFNYKNNLDNRSFATEMLQGSSVYIEYYEPEIMREASDFHISGIGYFYEDLPGIAKYEDGPKTVGVSGSCQVNINCSPEGDNWQNQKRGVAQITFLAGGDWYLCTGSLVNNTNNDGTPYFLTAFHCGASDATTTELNQWIFKFRYEAVGCTNPSQEPTTYSITGCTSKAKGNISGGSDMFLVLLNSAPTATHQPYYNGWNRNDNASFSNGVGIHHPAGDIKKISYYSTASKTTSTTNIGGSIMPATACWRTTWTSTTNGYGCTEGGSSGSPLFSSTGHIIGTLSGGSSACGTNNAGPDYYGRFSYHWDKNGSTNATKLQPWLDPTNTGATTLPGYDPFANLAPVVDFYASQTGILEGSSIDFFNLTENSPSSFLWTFEGGTPSSSTAAEPTGIVYNTPGTYSVTLQATNANGSDSKTKTDYITVYSSSDSFCEYLNQFCCDAALYSTTEGGYVSGTNEYTMTKWAERFQSYSPFNTLTGVRIFIAKAEIQSQVNVTFNVYNNNGNSPGSVIASKTISLQSIVNAYEDDGYIDITFDDIINIPTGGFYIGFDRPGTLASGNILALVSNSADGEISSAYTYYNNSWYLISNIFSGLENFQYAIFPLVCYDGEAPPIADFEASPTTVSEGNQVNFSDLSISTPPATNWLWTFEGGTPASSTLQNPVITYNTQGTYNVSLKVTNINGEDIISKQDYITVTEAGTCICDQISHTSSALGLTGVQDGGYVTGNNYYDDKAIAEYFDNNTGHNNLEGAYFNFGLAEGSNPSTNITFNVWEANGGSAGSYSYSPGTVLASKTYPLTSIAMDIENENLTYIDFGDIIDITNKKIFIGFILPTGLGENLAILATAMGSGTDEGWCQDEDNNWTSIGDAWGQSTNTAIYPVLCSEGKPIANFYANQTSVASGSTINFSDASTCSPTSWLWSFPGGTPTSSTLQNPNVVYNTPGVYNVSLTATNSYGNNMHTENLYISVTPAPETIVKWDFPLNSADKFSDAGIPSNDGTREISVAGGVNNPTFNTNGATTRAASATRWNTGNNTKYWQVSFETTAYENLKLSSKIAGNNTLSPRDFKVQYSLNGSTWTDVPNTAHQAANGVWNTTGVLTDIPLPQDCENKSLVYLRWIMTSNTSINGSTVNITAACLIDDIIVTGIPIILPPIAEFTASETSICEAESIDFTDQSTNDPISWSWNFQGGTPATSTSQNPSITYSTAGTYLVSLTVTNTGGSDTKTINSYITVNPNPTITASSNTPVCVGNDIELSANGSGGTSYAWTGPDSYTSNAQNPTITNAQTTHGGTYTVSLTNSGTGCSASASTDLTVNPNPTITASSNTPVCVGNDIELYANGSGGTSYAWTGPDSYTSNDQNPTITNAQTSHGGTYTVTLTNSVTGCSASANTDITVNPNPTITASSNTPICVGNDIELSANGSGGTSYAWTGPASYTSNDQNPTITNAQSTHSGTYTVTLTNSVTGCSASASTDLTVNPNPTITASNNTPVCVGNDIELSANGSGGTSYAWSGPASYTSNAQNPTITNAQTTHGGTYTVSLTNSVTGCSASANTDITVNPNPTITASSNSPVCVGNDIVLTANGSGGTSYAWSGPASFTASTQNPTITNAQTTHGGTYTVSLTNSVTGCSASANTDITVNPNPTITASSNTPICVGNDIELSANGSGGTSYAWSGSDSYTSNAQNPTITNAQTTHGGTYTVSLTNSGTGCSASASTSVTINNNPSIDLGEDIISCPNEVVVINAGGTGLSYLWSNSAISQSININTAGDYSLTVTDANSCTASDEINVSFYPQT
ncbi:MAG: PKD domain-containing protein, partial [Bacteroidales bacterium]|nr:PKD domain-containing protein [Bacteroidales bacterium]